MKLLLTTAGVEHAPVIASLLNEVALHLTSLYGRGHWSYQTSERSILNDMKGSSKHIIAKYNNEIVGALRLATKKPWAIDPAYFTRVLQPLYLTGMAVSPAMQRKGIGRYLLEEVKTYVMEWPAQSVRLDAYDAPAGAGDFYVKCGYTEKGRIVYRNNPLIYFERLF